MDNKHSEQRSLTPEDKIEVFRIATSGLVHHFCSRFKAGMSDRELQAALETTLGIFGGSGGPNRLSISYMASGLRIWGGWHVVNHVIERPLYSGQSTIAMARAIYRIANPDNDQLDLF